MDAFLVMVPNDVQRALLRDPAHLHSLIYESKTGRQRLDLGEAWAGLHFVLTSEVPIPKQEALRLGLSWDDDSLENVLMGGGVLPQGERWGPARYLSPQAVATLASKLSRISPEMFKGLYDPEALDEEGIPPGSWEGNPEALHLLMSHFAQLVEFYRTAVGNGCGILLSIVG